MICSMRTLPQISDNQTPSSNPEGSSLLLCRFSFLQVPGSFSLCWSFEAFFSQFFLFDLFALCMLFFYIQVQYLFIHLFYTFICLMRVLLYGFSIIIITILLLLLLLFIFLVFGFICLKHFLLLLLVLLRSNNSMSPRSNSQEKWN